MARDDSFLIVQFSDIHCGDSRFDPALMEGLIEDVNEMAPDLIIIPGDLTEKGYPDQFEMAKSYLDRIECRNRALIPGNHDSRNVGYAFFDRLFGPKYYSLDIPCSFAARDGVQTVRVVCADSSKPDLNEGEVGRDRYGWLKEQFAVQNAYKIFVVHHHLVPVPGTGRERNISWDAGDVLEILMESGVDLAFSGHKHVPYVWPLAGMLAITSGTATSWRTRGLSVPSYNIVRVRAATVEVEVRHSADRTGSRQIFAHHPGKRIQHVIEDSEKPDPAQVAALR